MASHRALKWQLLLLLGFFAHTCHSYPFRAQKASQDGLRFGDQDLDHVYNTSGVHHYPLNDQDCLIPGCMYERQPGEPSDPIWPRWWMSNWTMYVVNGTLAGANVPPWDSPPQGFNPGEVQFSSGWSYYDSSYQSGQGAMIEHYKDQCLQIFPMQLNWSCSFVSLGEKAYFLRYDDRPAGAPECCLFSKRNHAARRDFVTHLPYNVAESQHLGGSLQAYSVRPGGILFGYAFNKSYSPDTFDQSMAPYRHPHSFYFAGIYPDYEPLLVSQNYLDFRAQQPPADQWNLTAKCGTGDVEYCCLFDGDCPGGRDEPTPPTPPPCPTNYTLETARARLIELLTNASQLEQSLMMSYLYAGASLKVRPDQFSGPRKFYQYELVRAWKRNIYRIAREEMGHLHYTTALLVAVGGVPAFGVPDFPHDLNIGGPVDLVVSLNTFDSETLSKFLRYESSDLFLGLSKSDQQTIINRIIDDALRDRFRKLDIPYEHQQTVFDQVNEKRTNLSSMGLNLPLTVADFYAEISLLISCFPDVIDKGPHATEIQEELTGDQIGDAGVTLFPVPKRPLLHFNVTNSTEALSLIREILNEGEGGNSSEGGGILVNETALRMWLEYGTPLNVSDILDTDSHFYTFLRMVGEYQIELLSDPAFVPSRNLVTNPQIPPNCPNATQDRYALNYSDLAPNVTLLPCPDFTAATLASSLVDIFNRMYYVLTLWLQQGYIHQGGDKGLIAAESLMFFLFMTDVLRPTLEVIAAIPFDGNKRSSGAFQPYYRTGYNKGVVVLQEMMGAKTGPEIVAAFANYENQIRSHQRDTLFKIYQDLSKLTPFVTAAAPLYTKVYDQIVYNTQIMVDEYDARTCLGIRLEDSNEFHPDMTKKTPSWATDDKDRDPNSCQMSKPQSNVVWNSDFEERVDCARFGGDGALLQLHFRGWFQVRMATDPDPPNELSGATGNAFAFGNEPTLDRAIWFQRQAGVAPIRDIFCNAYDFGVRVTEIKGRRYQTQPVNFLELSHLAEDQNLTAHLQRTLRECKLNLLPVGDDLPIFKSDNYLLGSAYGGIDPFYLSLSCNGQEIARRTVVGPELQDMSPGQRQFTGRFSQSVTQNDSVVQAQRVGFDPPQPAWRYFRERQRLLQRELRAILPLNPADPRQAILIGRILDTFLPMPPELLSADDEALSAIQILRTLNISVLSRDCANIQALMSSATATANEAYLRANDCVKGNFMCNSFHLTNVTFDETSSQLPGFAVQLCQNPSQDPTNYFNSLAKAVLWLDTLVPRGAAELDIRFRRLEFDATFNHTLSGLLEDVMFSDFLRPLGYKLKWENRQPVNKEQECYGGVSNRWGITYDMWYMDTDLLWSWTEGDLWVPVQFLRAQESSAATISSRLGSVCARVLPLLAFLFWNFFG